MNTLATAPSGLVLVAPEIIEPAAPHTAYRLLPTAYCDEDSPSAAHTFLFRFRVPVCCRCVRCPSLTCVRQGQKQVMGEKPINRLSVAGGSEPHLRPGPGLAPGPGGIIFPLGERVVCASLSSDRTNFLTCFCQGWGVGGGARPGCRRKRAGRRSGRR